MKQSRKVSTEVYIGVATLDVMVGFNYVEDNKWKDNFVKIYHKCCFFKLFDDYAWIETFVLNNLMINE